MKHRFASDCHTHSRCSFDGKASPAAMWARAKELGLAAYTLTDHCECNKYEGADGHDCGYRQVVRKAWEEMEGLGEDCPMKKGVELGQPLQNLAAAEDALSGRDYDFVLGSVHNVAGERDFYYLGQQGRTPEQWDDLFSRYFREIIDMARWGGFDSLAHITYPLRYIPQTEDGLSFQNHQEELEEALTALIQAGKALEMNTSRLVRPGVSLPDLEVFTLYRRLGGRLVTLGSDAHRTEDLAQGIDLGMELLKQAGFSSFVVYEKRSPVEMPLE